MVQISALMQILAMLASALIQVTVMMPMYNMTILERLFKLKMYRFITIIMDALSRPEMFTFVIIILVELFVLEGCMYIITDTIGFHIALGISIFTTDTMCTGHGTPIMQRQL